MDVQKQETSLGDSQDTSKAAMTNTPMDQAIPAPEDLSLPTRSSAPSIIYGELSILGYNGSNPSSQRSGRRHKSKYILCQRSSPNGIKKSKHYIVKDEPQSTKAMQDKGRSTEEPIDFVLDTVAQYPLSFQHYNHNNTGASASSSRHQHRLSAAHSHSHHNHVERLNPSNENIQSSSSGRHQAGPAGAHDMMNMSRIQRNLAKVGFELVDHLRFAEMGVGPPPPAHGLPDRVTQYGRVQAAPMMYNFQQQPHMHHIIPEHQQHLYPSMYHSNNAQQMIRPQPAHANDQAAPSYLLNHANMNKGVSSRYGDTSSSRNNRHNSGDIPSKRSHSTNSTISRFSCRILVDRKPPYTARIYAAGFDSSKNIFLGEKAPKWEKDNSIDGLTTNGILLRHPILETSLSSTTKFHDSNLKSEAWPCVVKETNEQIQTHGFESNFGDIDRTNNNGVEPMQTTPNDSESGNVDEFHDVNSGHGPHNESAPNDTSKSMTRTAGSISKDLSDSYLISEKPVHGQRKSNSITNNESGPDKQNTKTSGGVWREVSVDGGIYAIRQNRSASQIGNRILDEFNILQDGTLIDLCGATLLWRSVDGLRIAPTKMCLEEKLDKLNSTRPQCPVGLNTLVVPKKLSSPTRSGDHHDQRYTHYHHRNHHHHLQHHQQQYSPNSGDKINSHQPYVYFKCGHVQGHHDWGTTEGSSLRTCPICLSVGTTSRLSMGLETSFYVNLGALTHAFNPCGHMTTERTARYWSSVKIPYGTHFFQSICPFCAIPLAQPNYTNSNASTTINEEPFTRLIFQDELD